MPYVEMTSCDMIPSLPPGSGDAKGADREEGEKL